MVIVVVLPFPQLLVEQVDVVAHPVLVEDVVELLVIRAMRALDLAIESPRAWANVDVPNVVVPRYPVELGLNPAALSVRTTCTRNGSRRRTSSTNWMAVR